MPDAHANHRSAATSTRRRVALRQPHPARHRIAAPQPSRQPMRQADDHRGLQPQPPAAGQPRQIDRRAVQRIDPIQQRIEHRAAAPAWPPRRASCHRPHTSRQIAAVQRGEVLRAVLQMVQHLQRRAQRVRGHVGRAILAVQIEHVPSDRHRRVAAVVIQLVPVRIAQLGRVAPERDQQIERMARRHAGFGQARAQTQRARRAIVAAGRAARPPSRRAARSSRPRPGSAESAMSSALRAKA